MEYKDLKKTFLTIGYVRVLLLVTNFVITSLLLRLLDIESYGVYTALFSVLSWMFLFDIGISKGMRNHLTKSLVNEDFVKARRMISTTYITTLGVVSVFFLVIFFFSRNIDFISFLNIVNYSNQNIYSVFLVFVFIMFAKLFLGTINQVLYARHKSSTISFINLSINVCFITTLLLLMFLQSKSVLKISILYGFSVIVTYLYFTFRFFIKNRNLLPNFKYYSSDLVKVLLNDGFKILFIQTMFFLFLGLDRIILLKYGSGSEVTDYDIMYKVMSLLLFPWSIIAQPLWSSYAEAYNRKDLNWIKKIYNRLIILFGFTVIGVFGLSYFFDDITNLWLNVTLDVDLRTLLLTGLLILLIMWSTMHSDLLFGLSKYNVLLISVIIGVILKFMIVVSTVDSFFKIEDLILSSIVAYSIFSIVSPVYIFLFLKKK